MSQNTTQGAILKGVVQDGAGNPLPTILVKLNGPPDHSRP